VRGLPAVHPIFVAYRACAEVKRYVPMTVGALSLGLWKKYEIGVQMNVYSLSETLAFARMSQTRYSRRQKLMTAIAMLMIELAVIVGIVLEGLLFERSFDAIKKRLVTPQPSVGRVPTAA
jgi:cytochrome b subunit of formate dehydrogenase